MESTQDFDKQELLECIRQLIEVDKDWVPDGNGTSLYVRPVLIGNEVGTWELPPWEHAHLCLGNTQAEPGLCVLREEAGPGALGLREEEAEVRTPWSDAAPLPIIALAGCRYGHTSPPVRHPVPRGLLLPWRLHETCFPPGGPRIRQSLDRWSW